MPKAIISDPLQARADALARELDATRRAVEIFKELRSLLEAHPGLKSTFAEQLQEFVVAGNSGLHGPFDDIIAKAAAEGRLKAVAEFITKFSADTNHGKIADYFVRNNNRPSTVEKISSETGVSEAIVRHLMNRRFPHNFVTEELAGEKLKHWRMRTPEETKAFLEKNKGIRTYPNLA